MNMLAISVFVYIFSAPSFAQLSEALPVQEVRPAGTPGVRTFPANVRRATLQVLTTPEVLLDGKAERLSPGARIRSPQNLIVQPASLVGLELVVNVLRNARGELQEVWLLTELEAEQKVQTNTPARNFIFASEADVSRKDDGKTPFKELPTFEDLRKPRNTR